MAQSILNYLDKFTPEILLIQVGFLLIVMSVFAFIWLQNKKRYNHLKHQIPANVVKSYLDSMIQNANSLKSSLFRGGGMDIDPNSIPSVFPLGDLGGGDQAQVMGTNSEELRLKLAEIAQLRAQVQEKNGTIKEFENNVTTLRGENRSNQDRISELERMLNELRKGAGGGDPTLAPELEKTKKERDELKQRLKEYSIIEDDLANLKRLKQENEQLKRSLGQPVVETPAPKLAEVPAFEEPAPQIEEPAPEAPVEAAPVMEEFGSEQTPDAPPPTFESAPELPEETVAAAQEEAPEAAAEAPAAPEEKKDEKSPEDLLSEFEKMLG